MNKIMLQSAAGKSITVQLEKLHKNNITTFKQKEEELKNKETSIVSQKNVLTKEEFEKKINSLRKEANEYRIKRRDLINSLTKKRVEAQNKLIKTINPILADYSKKNSISMIIQKKNIIIGKSELEITDDILEILDKSLKTIDLN
ncbi:MAG: OmpH family outer membrane protein [Pelagibacterales bacterium]|nr:OmpH family outer membrane protein [Pelagibacterales bacterium]